MKKTNDTVLHIQELERISVLIICFGALLSFCAYLICIFLMVLQEKLFGDYSTALYWSGEFFLFGKEIIGATVVPALLFENIITASGIKFKLHQNDKKI